MKSLCLGLICLSMLASCGGNDGSKNKRMDPDKFRGIDALEAEETVVYMSGCLKSKVDGEVNYTMARFELNMINAQTATMKLNQVMFSENCEYALLENEVKGEGRFNVHFTLLRTDVDVISMRPLMDEMTDYMNENFFCDSDDWQTMMMKDITQSSCVEGELSGDIYLDTKNNGSDLTIYLCEPNATLSNKCEKLELKKQL